MTKPFKTHNQLLKILRNRGVVISDGAKAKRILERENYYCIINGYKLMTSAILRREYRLFFILK